MRGVRKALATATAAVVGVTLFTSCGASSEEATVRHCALLADAIGLYPGNPVTQMGYRIGTVTAVEPASEHVRVDFEIGGSRPMPAEVKAVVRSMSILADRSLELVGNYVGGEQFSAEECVPMQRTATPKSLSQLVGSIATFADTVNPEGSTDIADTVSGLAEALDGQGAPAAGFVTRLSSLVESPDQAISDTGSIVANMAALSGEIVSVRGTLKQVLLDAEVTTPDLVTATGGVARMTDTLPLMVSAVADLERELGVETQRMLDTVSVPLRKVSPHATALAGVLAPVGDWLWGISDRYNVQGLQLKWRPPMFRIRTQDGLLLCGQMNARVPGSCADVAGTPYAVDVALLQYALAEAGR